MQMHEKYIVVFLGQSRINRLVHVRKIEQVYYSKKLTFCQANTQSLGIDMN